MRIDPCMQFLDTVLPFHPAIGIRHLPRGYVIDDVDKTGDRRLRSAHGQRAYQQKQARPYMQQDCITSEAKAHRRGD